MIPYIIFITVYLCSCNYQHLAQQVWPLQPVRERNTSQYMQHPCRYTGTLLLNKWMQQCWDECGRCRVTGEWKTVYVDSMSLKSYRDTALEWTFSPSDLCWTSTYTFIPHINIMFCAPTISTTPNPPPRFHQLSAYKGQFLSKLPTGLCLWTAVELVSTWRTPTLLHGECNSTRTALKIRIKSVSLPLWDNGFMSCSKCTFMVAMETLQGCNQVLLLGGNG